jgi:hypothetical protein
MVVCGQKGNQMSLCFRLPPMKEVPVRHALLSLAAGLVCVAARFDCSAGGAIESTGDILQFVLPATAGGMTIGYRDWEGSLQFGESVALSMGVTYGLKYAVNETRPNGGHQSFPSGHSSISFTAAEFIRKRYGWWYGIPAYAGASFVAYSRVEAHEHYPHDVIAGASIGIVSSYIFTRPYKGWHVQAEATDKYWGLSLSRNW